jgi:succinate dehydrogenase hydrophobic anchor subunit
VVVGRQVHRRGADGASFTMAMATGVALLCYVAVLFSLRLTEGADR